MKTLVRAVALLAFLAAPLLAHAVAPDLGPQAPLPVSKDLYSFADLYRLAAGGAELPAPWGPGESSADVQFRVRTVGAVGATPATAYVFSTSRGGQPQGGLLLLAGLASVLWVARRRLGLPIRR